MPTRCEAKVITMPDTLLSENGSRTSISCQRCEIPISEVVVRERDLESLRDVDNFVQYFLQRCPRLIVRGYQAGQIPTSLLPNIEKV